MYYHKQQTCQDISHKTRKRNTKIFLPLRGCAINNQFTLDLPRDLEYKVYHCPALPINESLQEKKQTKKRSLLPFAGSYTATAHNSIMKKKQTDISQKRLSPLAESFAFHLYQLLWTCAIPCLRHNRRLQQGFAQRTLQTMPPKADLWIQAASVGEAYLAQELICTLTPKESTTILLSSNTSQGMEILEQSKHKAEKTSSKLTIHTTYFPFDQPSLMDKALTAISPKVMLLLESELWPGLLKSCKSHQVKILLINGRMTAKSLSNYQKWPSLWYALRPEKILAMSAENGSRFSALFGNDIVETMHNIKFDRIDDQQQTACKESCLPALLPADCQFIVLGSIRKEEEHVVSRLINSILKKNSKAIIGLFPRHMHRLQKWKKIFTRLSLPWQLRSETTGQVSCGTILLWDTMGELSAGYEAAHAAFVGGSLAPVGGQNFLEPLTSGLKPVIGPHWTNFTWVGREIIDQKLVYEAQDWQGVADYLLQTVAEQHNRNQVRRDFRKYVRHRKGGTVQACAVIRRFLAG